MLAIIGLGNPGEKYQQTRHNAGFMVVDRLAERLNVETWEGKFQSLVAKTQDFLLVKPQTFMNNSGQAVGEVMQFYKLAPDQLVVIHDDVDLALGEIKVKQGGGNAGHHGLESIDQAIGTNYWRVRVGIGRDELQKDVTDHVLSPFADEEQLDIDQVTDQVIELINQHAEKEI